MISRLIEDTIILETIEHSTRKRQLHCSLLSQSGKMVDMALKVLDDYHVMENLYMDPKYMYICESFLGLLNALLSWIPANDLEPKVQLIFRILCSCLNCNLISIKSSGIDCMYQILLRKGSKKEVEVLFNFFHLDFMNNILTAVE
ncbi:unnamed protein product [Soboliphyme baturini]|uniref:Ovule protein n=1 Tax=Soboliphyme baturini TaxID=241478 RepID=A0A183IRQ4_9BILA|nr:unnamed protein product [Soboliphyme baturini]